ncbi:MAG: MBL fold metallo-hydrolase [Chitinophagaceae bacterium]|nr:MBL fold metallo-hydrolase [Chitinophagaceae bacterium]
MTVEQLYTNCLSEAAYFIESNGEAAVIDPLRDYQAYIALAAQKGVTIKYIFETHFHADFVSGHIDLANKTGAPIIYGPETVTNYPVTVAANHQHFKIGAIEIEVMHTPGHTPESTCYLLRDESGEPHCIFTGDTLFVGDVGRPDLFGATITKEEMASRMFDSLNEVKKLPDHVIVYPAHGPGSSCGKNIGKETWSTIGVQKKLNYALQDLSRDEFIKAITSGLSKPPQYFPLNARINRLGYSSLDDVLQKSMRPMTAEEFAVEMKKGTLVIDTRHENIFEKGFVPGSIFIGLNGRFAEWVGTLISMDEPVLLVTETGKEEETIIRMARVGYDNVIGFLEGGFDAWKDAGKEFDMVISIDADEFNLDYKHDDLRVVDVRKESEYESGHVAGAVNVVLQQLDEQVSKLEDKEEALYVHCLGGYRSMIAASLLKRKGYHQLKNITGGWQAISKTDVAIELPKFSVS